VHDVRAVRRFERTSDRDRDAHRFRRCERAVAIEPRGQALAIEMLHRDVEQAVLGTAEVEQTHHVRALDSARCMRLALEARDRGGVSRELATQDLQRDPPLHHQVIGRVDGAHPAFAEQLGDAEPPGHHRAEQGVDDRLRCSGPAARG
jgi:hypothetical protein